jgi:hypothetical protein
MRPPVGGDDNANLWNVAYAHGSYRFWITRNILRHSSHDGFTLLPLSGYFATLSQAGL